VRQISPEQLKQRLGNAAAGKPLLLDVREPWEFQICSVPGSVLIPMRTVPARIAELDDSAETVVICHHGVRSMQVASFLAHQGFSRVYNLSGGVDGWARSVEPSMPVY
jgi:rhodanese-related sulfurtransferase